MHQQTFAEVSFEQYRKPTRREQFLNDMNGTAWCRGRNW